MTDNEMLPWESDIDVGTFDYADLGTPPPITKDEYNGKVIVVVGISEGEFTGDFDEPALSLFHWLPEFPVESVPYGLLLGKSSTALTQARGQLEKNGGKPFFARLLKVQGRKYPYWKLDPVSPVFTQDGRIGGFRTRQGEVITNKDKPQPLPDRKAK